MRFILSKFNSLLFSLFWFLLASRREVIGIPQIEGIFHFIFPAIGALSPAPYFPLFFLSSNCCKAGVGREEILSWRRCIPLAIAADNSIPRVIIDVLYSTRASYHCGSLERA